MILRARRPLTSGVLLLNLHGARALEPWGGLRAVFDALSRGGPVSLPRHLTSLERVALSLVPDLDIGGLTPDERARRERVSGEHWGRLPDVYQTHDPLPAAWMGALAKTLAGEECVVRALEPLTLDLESLRVLRDLAATGCGLRLEVAPVRGRWSIDESDEVSRLRVSFYETVLRSVPGLGDRADGALDARVPPSQDGSLRGPFQSYAHSVTVERFVQPSAGGAMRREPAQILMAAVGMHNLAPFDPRASALAVRWFRDVLAVSDDPIERAHALYRCCVHAVRHRGDVEEGIALGSAAVSEAVRVEGPPWLRGLLGAWARNARAFAFYRAGRTEEALASCERALAELEPFLPLPPEDIARDAVHAAREQLMVNLTRVRAARA